MGKLISFDLPNIYSQLLFCVFLIFDCSGCMTETVRNVGARTETLELHKVLIATNGAIAIECTAIYEHPTVWGKNGTPYPEKGRSEKYLVGSSEIVQTTISNALAAKFHPKPKLINPDLKVVCITQFVFHQDSTNSEHWLVIPNVYGGKDAKSSDLPDEFKYLKGTYPITTNAEEGSFYYPIRYHFGSIEYQLVFFNPSVPDYRKFRKWWGYPSQILLVLAFPFDVVAFPVEFVVSAYYGYVE